MRKKIWLSWGFWLICFLFLWLAFALAAASHLDPDFGWHFRTGEWIWHHQAVPKTDLFSYTMPDYPWKYPAWFSELLIYRLFPWFDYSGLAVFFGFFAALALVFFVSPKKISFAYIPLFLAGLACLNFMGVRPKMISFLLAALVFGLIRKSYQKPQWLLVLPFLFLVWVNLHGGFSIGLGVLSLSVWLIYGG